MPAHSRAGAEGVGDPFDRSQGSRGENERAGNESRAVFDRERLYLFARDAAVEAWKSTPGWAALADILRLGPLDDASALKLLERRGAPSPARARLARLAKGHPLALELAARALEVLPARISSTSMSSKASRRCSCAKSTARFAPFSKPRVSCVAPRSRC